MKVAIIEPHLVDYTGHYYSFVSELKRGFEEMGDEVEVFLLAHSEGCIRDRKLMLPWKNSKGNILQRYFCQIKDIAKVHKLLKGIQRDSDLLIFTTADNMTLIGGITILKTTKPLFLYFHWLRPFFNPIRKTLKLLQLSQNISKKEIFFLTPANVSQDILQSSFFKNIKIFSEAPYPLTPRSKAKEVFHSHEFYLAYLGDARIEKHFLKLTELIKRASDGIKYIVQCNPPSPGKYEPEIEVEKNCLKKMGRENLILIESPPPSNEYYEMFTKSSLIWCLYDAEAYKDRISGILLEAWVLGKPVLTTAGTWMARQVEKYGGGIILEDLEIDNILKAIETIKTNYQKFSAEALNAGKALYENNNGVALAKFIKQILISENKREK